MKGKISAAILKVMAVVSALAIGGGYVAWQQIESDKARERERADQSKAKAQEELELIVGSKNPVRKMLTDEEVEDYLERGKDFIEPIPGLPEGGEGVANETTLLPGSKSISMPLFTKEQIKHLKPEDEGAKEAEIVPKNLLPSSKTGLMRFREIEPEPPGEKQPKLLPGSKSGILIPEKAEPEKSK